MHWALIAYVFAVLAPGTALQPGAARLIYGSPATAAAPASPEAASPHTQAGSSSSPGATSTAQQAAIGQEAPPPGSEAVSGEEPARQLLHISFTKDPPDEFNVGANFMCGIPFPFITIRTNKLEVRGTWPIYGSAYAARDCCY